MSGFRRLPIRDSSKSSYMLMRVKNQEFEFDAGCSFLELLPLELQEKIFRKLSNADVRHLTFVSKTIRATVCDSYALMSRFMFAFPIMQELLQIPNDMMRKYSSVTFSERFSYRYAENIMPYLRKYGYVVKDASFLQFVWPADLLRILSAFPNLAELKVVMDYDFVSLQDPINAAWRDASREQLDQFYTANMARLNNDSQMFLLSLLNLHTLEVNIQSKYSMYMGAKLKHLSVNLNSFEKYASIQNVACFLEHQRDSLVSLSFKNYGVTRFHTTSAMFEENKISLINLKVKELIFDSFAIQDHNNKISNVISFVQSQQGSLIRLKLIRSNFLTAASFPAFVAAASRIQELFIDFCPDLSWLPLFLDQEDIRLRLLHIKNCAIMPNVLIAIADNRDKIGQLIIV